MKRLYTLLLTAALSSTLIALPAASATTSSQLTAIQANEISTAYDHLTGDFYKKVDPQAVINSVRSELLFAMRTAGIKNASLPTARAMNAAANVHAI
ncbi:MAG TPA: hypothetical protein VNG31_04155, partial [Candidatus Baltobacteraceae bacterium]|nr:hypothetical protein [Candidatus Baltobacteraceae bacterium]